jgi:uncharacterized protein YfkK (UPF0435 family)
MDETWGGINDGAAIFSIFTNPSTLMVKGDRYQMEMDLIAKEINTIKTAVSSLRQIGKDVPALDRNLQRISASLKMLELNFLDPEKYCQSK